MSGQVSRGSLASIRLMSGQVSRGLAGDYQSDERAGVARLSWRVSKGIIMVFYKVVLRSAESCL